MGPVVADTEDSAGLVYAQYGSGLAVNSDVAAAQSAALRADVLNPERDLWLRTTEDSAINSRR
jgi:hypothetical protein